MDKPLVSVIVPVYNVAKYLDECIESITRQTYDNLEIILLPGASTDNSTKICDGWVKKDSRIRIVDQDKNSLAYARNKGIAHSQGDYLAFCDSDDKLMPSFIEDLVSSALENNSDITECEYYNASEDMTNLTSYNVLELLKDFNHSFYERFGSPSVWKYLVKRSFWIENDFHYPESIRMEDLAVYSLLFAKAKRCSFVYKPLYLYRQNPKSMMHTREDLQKLLSNFCLIAEYTISEFNRIGIYETNKSTIISQFEHHAGFNLEPYNDITGSDRANWEIAYSEEIKRLFSINTTVYDVRAMGWGSERCGLLCKLLTKRCNFESRYIRQMTLRGMTSVNIREQFEELCKQTSPNLFIIDLLEEIDFIQKYEGSIDDYISQWKSGVLCLKDSLSRLAPSIPIFIIERYLAKKKLADNKLIPLPNPEDIDVFNELLEFMYKRLQQLIENAIIIKAIPESSRYSLTDDPRDGHNYDDAYYYEQIVDVLHGA